MMVYLYIKVCNTKTQDEEDDIGGEKIRTNSVHKNLFPKHLFNSKPFPGLENSFSHGFHDCGNLAIL